MVENVLLIQRYFPDWKVYVYVAPDVEQDMMNFLRSSSNVVVFETNICGPKNMIHRFYAIDELGVELMMVRDADSRISWKDRWAIRDFLDKPKFVAHTIRDHIEHTARLMGGLWGLRKSAGISIRQLYASYIEDTSKGHRIAHDQNFLMDVVYPIIASKLLVHYSHNRLFQGEFGIPFPFEWSNENYCGRIESRFIDVPEPKSSGLHLPSVKINFLNRK